MPERTWLSTSIVLLLGYLSVTLALQSMLADANSSAYLGSFRFRLVSFAMNGDVQTDPASGDIEPIPFERLLIPFVLASGAVALVVLLPGVLRTRSRPGSGLTNCLFRSGIWLNLVGVHEIVRLACFLCGFDVAGTLLTVLLRFSLSVGLAGWLSELVQFSVKSVGQDSETKPVRSWSVSKTVLAAMVLYVVVFSTMNWKLYDALLIPHGDSAMYEEHLWNISHGKGFRSYLDQGLFLGEHVQVVHLLLLPLHLIWPSQTLLELCETIALACGAVPAFWMARRHTESTRTATLFAIAWLLYPAMQFLDIAIDLKTFRPTSFGVPAMLFAFDQMERGRWKTTLALFVLALSAKEDYALVLGPLGLWLAVDVWLSYRRTEDRPRLERVGELKRGLIRGGLLAVGSVAYLLLVTRVVIPWFRGGDEVHYARYFAEFGDSLGEIIVNIVTDPALLLSQLATAASANYLLALLVPLMFLPLLSPSRFLVAVPILGLLCLNEIVKSDPYPRHHFQAPVLPVLFWAATAGAGRLHAIRWKWLGWMGHGLFPAGVSSVALLLVLGCLVGNVFQSISPVSLTFWDAESGKSWKAYQMTERSERFAAVFEQIPMDARVASTDFVHTRFTHHERSYDYSGYLRKVAGYEDRVPDDTDYIVIDTSHRYSTIKRPEDVRELQREPQNWELIDDRTGGLFIILKRRK